MLTGLVLCWFVLLVAGMACPKRVGNRVALKISAWAFVGVASSLTFGWRRHTTTVFDLSVFVGIATLLLAAWPKQWPSDSPEPVTELEQATTTQILRDAKRLADEEASDSEGAE